MDVINELVNRANLSLNLLQIVPLTKTAKFICQVKIELDASEHFSHLKLGISRTQENRVLFLGAAGSGKTTLLSVLGDWGALDDGRGKMRTRLLHHRHELLSGSTSSVIHQPLVFLNNTPNPLTLTDDSILLQLERRRTILNEGRVIQLVDSAGKLRFDRTVFSVLTSSTHKPSLAFIVIEAPPISNSPADAIEIPQQTIENFRFLQCLNIPTALLINKIDQSCTEAISNLLESVSGHVGDKILTIYDDEDEDNTEDESKIPVLLTSAVTGDFLPKLTHFLYTQTTKIPKSLNLVKNPFLYAQESAKSALIIEQVVNLVDVGYIAYGQVAFGIISVGDLMILGPQDHGNPVTVRIKSIQRLKCPVSIAHTSQHVSIALQFVNEKPTNIRRGMALINLKPNSNLTLKPLKRIIAEVEHVSGGPKPRFYGIIYLMGQRFPATLQVQTRSIRHNSLVSSSNPSGKNLLVCLVSFPEKKPASAFLFPGAAIIFIGSGRREKFAGQVIDYFA